ncbi:hypothetical protein [Rhodococcus pyridinivorans]|uniref:hypothetical protein n=1 Tax=Rhodococcus pyridinivorans TaxID=103816 RepID=UPI0039B62DC9
MVETTPVRAVMGFRLIIERHKIGALNLFSATAGAFTTEAAAQASVLTAFASVDHPRSGHRVPTRGVAQQP